MNFVILGLILLKPMTGYEISRFIKNNLSMICSNSAGSVQAAIKKLVFAHSVVFEEYVDNGKNKKIFQITEKGKSEFYLWIQNPMQTEKIKNMELSKLFFLGFAAKEKRIESINNYVLQLQTVKNTLTFIKDEFEKIKKQSLEMIESEKAEEILIFQGYTLDYGIESAEFEMKWYTKLLKDMED